MHFSMKWMRDRYSVTMRSGRARLDGRFERHKFRSDRWIGIKLLLEFPDAVFHGVDEESILDDDEVRSSQGGWTGRKAITFYRPLDRDQTFTGVSGCTFPWSG